jgi:hypothetical protein
MKRINLSPGGLRTDAIVAGDFGVDRVRSALVSTGTRRTVIAADLAADITSAAGRKSCTTLLSLGRVCGVTAKISVAIPGCRAVPVQAVAVPMPRGHELTIGRDVIERVVRRIDFATNPATISCRARRRPPR